MCPEIHKHINFISSKEDFAEEWKESIIFLIYKKQSHYMPGQAVRVSGGCSSYFLRQSAHEGGNVVSHMHKPPLLSENIPGTHFC